MKNAIFRELMQDKLKIQYDTQCKKLLGNKIILAWILKYTTEEFATFKIAEIIPCIEGEPEIGAAKVDPGETNKIGNSEKISGSNTEDGVVEEGKIYFDIRFFVFHPVKKEKVKIIINVEAQKSFYPGYSITTRGIFYGARMLSAQLGTEFSVPDYDNIKKVYSIWICMNAPKYIGNAIAEYSMKKRDIVAGLPDKRREYDKISVVVVCLNDEKENDSELTEMLNVLLSEKVSEQEKVKRLQEEFEIPMENNVEKEVSVMCNLSDLVEERGIAKGEILVLISQIQKKIQKGKTIEKIAEEVEEEVEVVKPICDMIKKYPEDSREIIYQKLA